VSGCKDTTKKRNDNKKWEDIFVIQHFFLFFSTAGRISQVRHHP
jgi:hypothetical protein